MPWLACDGRVVASLEIARTPAQRRRGLLGRDHTSGALLIERCRSVHTVGMRFAIDVAYLDSDGLVLEIVTMKPWRVGRPRLRARSVVESAAGAFERWGVRRGDQLEFFIDSSIDDSNISDNIDSDNHD